MIIVEYEGERHTVNQGETFDIGRDADLSLDQNPYLHRRLLRIVHERDFWWIVNIGGQTTVMVTDQGTGLQAWLEPANRLPLLFDQMDVVFTAGPCTYKLSMINEGPTWQLSLESEKISGDTTVYDTSWTTSQKLAVLALAEPMLSRESFGLAHVPTNAEAAERLGWPLKRFEKKLDNVCMKLDRLGLDGMRGGMKQHASGRRTRLVEWAVSTGFVTRADLPLLDNPPTTSNDDD